MSLPKVNIEEAEKTIFSPSIIRNKNPLKRKFS